MTTAPPTIEGIFLSLRPVEPADAAYIHHLRTDPRYNTHLSPVTGSVDDQRAWIERYKRREADGAEVYFIIERKDGRPCGTVRIYDVADTNFTWGSWILDHNKPPKAALESALLSFGYGFDTLDRAEALVDVRRDNNKALDFYRRFGMTETGMDDRDVYFTYPRSQFHHARPVHLAAVRRAAEDEK